MSMTQFFSSLLLVNTLLAILVIVMERRNTRSTWIWIMIMVLMPGIGFILYLWLGRDFNKRRMFEDKEKLDSNLHKMQSDFNVDAIGEFNKAIEDRPYLKKYHRLVQMLYLNSLSRLTYGNEVDSIFHGEEMFDRLFEDIKRAEKYVYIQTYIMRSDVLGTRIIDLLIAKAREGLDVKFLSDGMGARAFRKKDIRRMKEAGIDVQIFFPFFISFISPRINYRNHRKIFVIDGRIGYIGGYNIGDEYIDGGKDFEYWRDSAVRVVGPAVKKMQNRVELDFSFAAGHNVKYSTPLPFESDCKGAPIQFVTAGPDSEWPSIKDGFLKMISLASKTIYIETPYFIPDDSVLESLRVASLSGVDIKIMIPYKGDHPFIFWANLSYVGDLIKAGVKFYLYEAGFEHAKVIIVDDEIVSVGTSNMDERSFHLNFEANAFIYDQEIAKEFSKNFLDDLENHSTLITENLYNKRSKWVKVKENFSRLLSPLL